MSIQLKGSHISKVAPAINEIEERELAVNTKDGKLYTKTPEGTIIEIGADNINTGLETPTPTGGIHSGHRYINSTDLADFLPLGTDATDLTYSSGSNPGSASIGAHGTGSFTVGIDATAKGSDSVAIGRDAYVVGNSSFAIGNNVEVLKNLSFSIGNNSQIGGSTGTIGSFSLGSNNYIAGDGSSAIGSSNNIPYNNAVAIGTDNSILLNNSYAIGYNLKTNNVDGNIAIGKFNDPKSNMSFMIGDGTSDTNRSNVLELNSNTGVLTLPKLNVVGNIQNSYDVITLGYLESYSNLVKTVNTYSGNVVLTVADIDEQGGVDRLWFTQDERNQLSANTSAISTKEPLLPTAAATDKVLTVVDPVTRTWAWKTIGSTSVSMGIGDLTDVLAFDSVNDTNKYLKVNGAGTRVEYSYLQRNELNLLNDGGSTTDPISGNSFELSSDPYFWGINKSTYILIDNLNTLDAVPDTTNDGDKLVVKFTVIDHNDGYVTQSYEIDTASNLPYDNGTSGLASTDVQGAIDELNTSVSSSTLSGLTDTSISSPTNLDVLVYDGINWINNSNINSSISTNTSSIGVLGNLTTTSQSDLVSAINEVDANTDSNTAKIEGTIITDGNTDSQTVGGRYGMIGTPTNGPKAGEFYLEVFNDGSRVMQVATFNDGSIFMRIYDSSWSAWTENRSYPIADEATVSTVNNSGDTASRPSTTIVGQSYFDTDLTKPIWWDGSQWVDATGTTV